MAVVIQYEFNTEGQWKSAGEPKLIDTADEIVVLGYNGETKKYHVEVLFIDESVASNNGLLDAKAVSKTPHQFIGYPTFLTDAEIAEQENVE